jgi:hypothetical protein
VSNSSTPPAIAAAITARARASSRSGSVESRMQPSPITVRYLPLARCRKACCNDQVKSLALVCVLAATGCKCSSDSSSTSSSSSAGSEESADGSAAAPTGRSGKIDLGLRPRPPAGDSPAAPTTDVEAARKARIAELDTDGDGTVTEDERRAARGRRAQELRTTLDVDKDGKVTVAELASSRFRRLDPESIDADKNGDISVAEITTALEQRSTAWGAGRVRDRLRPQLRAGSGSGQ